MDDPTGPFVQRSRLTRRRFARTAAAFGASASIGAPVLHALAQATPEGAASPQASPVAPPLPTFTSNASITSWGFGAEETNPMAFSRIDAFKQAYPSIKLELVPQFDDQKLLTGFASKQLPDILWMDRFKIGSWAARGVIQPIDDLVKQAGIDLNKYYPPRSKKRPTRANSMGCPASSMSARSMSISTPSKRSGRIRPSSTPAIGIN
jgi:ABC-type glycerol-3-phosphate transport system substrate-binding protein